MGILNVCGHIQHPEWFEIDPPFITPIDPKSISAIFGTFDEIWYTVTLCTNDGRLLKLLGSEHIFNHSPYKNLFWSRYMNTCIKQTDLKYLIVSRLPLSVFTCYYYIKKICVLKKLLLNFFDFVHCFFKAMIAKRLISG